MELIFRNTGIKPAKRISNQINTAAINYKAKSVQKQHDILISNAKTSNEKLKIIKNSENRSFSSCELNSNVIKVFFFWYLKVINVLNFLKFGITKQKGVLVPQPQSNNPINISSKLLNDNKRVPSPINVLLNTDVSDSVNWKQDLEKKSFWDSNDLNDLITNNVNHDDSSQKDADDNFQSEASPNSTYKSTKFNTFLRI